ncbi:MAG: phosphate-starvation-inducible E-like protein, partial [Deltaproteobacteria bacterium]|nr:phosphate-starvation-inducible E-like protein [Deltaproteobacteria bacterium]
MLKILGKFEMVVIGLLITMMVFIILVSTIRLGWTLSQELIKSHTLLLDSQQLFKLFGFILMIILGLEILDSIKAYITEDQIHV